MNRPVIGSLCTGAGGLDMAVEAVTGGKVAWHCETEAHAAAVLRHRFPGVPNHGDIETVDWAAVKPIEILTGGYPCQPFSQAGKKKGSDDERHIWPAVREAIRQLRPRITVLENVSGHRTLGFGDVLRDLAADGMDARWVSVRAADVGACHGRERLFFVAFPADAAGDTRGFIDGNAGAVGVRWEPPRKRPNRRRRKADGVTLFEADVVELDGVDLLPTPSVADGDGGHTSRSGDRINERLLGGLAVDYAAGALLPTPTVGDSKGTRNSTATRHRIPPTGIHSGDTLTDILLPTPRAADADAGPDFARAGRPDSGGDDLVTAAAKAARWNQWGQYGPAIRRWEAITRPAPPPAHPNSVGTEVLNPAFSEWMMGWPEGWVTDPAIGLGRAAALRIIGNGVVPQAAFVALHHLLTLNPKATHG